DSSPVEDHALVPNIISTTTAQNITATPQQLHDTTTHAKEATTSKGVRPYQPLTRSLYVQLPLVLHPLLVSNILPSTRR
ncbi:unnamed protein product, partial [Ilex paraguariensis]